jgi:four helix bundle protein
MIKNANSRGGGDSMDQFDHEKLQVYQKAIEFVAWASSILEEVPKSISAHNQLDRASTSISLNLAEGNGKSTSADRCRYFDNARGSSLECAACLDILVAKRIVVRDRVGAGKRLLLDIVSMTVGLIRANSKDRDI